MERRVSDRWTWDTSGTSSAVRCLKPHWGQIAGLECLLGRDRSDPAVVHVNVRVGGLPGAAATSRATPGRCGTLCDILGYIDSCWSVWRNGDSVDPLRCRGSVGARGQNRTDDLLLTSQGRPPAPPGPGCRPPPCRRRGLHGDRAVGGRHHGPRPLEVTEVRVHPHRCVAGLGRGDAERVGDEIPRRGGGPPVAAGAAGPALGPGRLAGVEEHLPVAAEIGDEVGPAGAGQRPRAPRTGRTARPRPSGLDVPRRLGVAEHQPLVPDRTLRSGVTGSITQECRSSRVRSDEAGDDALAAARPGRSRRRAPPPHRAGPPARAVAHRRGGRRRRPARRPRTVRTRRERRPVVPRPIAAVPTLPNHLLISATSSSARAHSALSVDEQPVE